MKHPSPLVWFRFHAGDLPFFAWLSFRVHVGRCPPCGARLRAEQAERAAVEAALDGRRPAERARPRIWLAVPALAAAAAIWLLVVRPPQVVFGGSIEAPTTTADGMRAKGGSAFHVFVAGHGDGGASLLGDRCRPGDALQAQYRSEKAFLMIVGVDPEGHARTLVPLDGTASTPMRPGVQQAPQSWILDAAPGRERFVAFFSDAPLDAAQAHAAAAGEHPRIEGATVVVRECTKAVP